MRLLRLVTGLVVASFVVGHFLNHALGVVSIEAMDRMRIARRIRAGQVDVNGGAFNLNAPFGGFKQSGHGREAGVYGLEEFLEYKSLQLKG